MAALWQIVIVGAGNLGNALAMSLRSVGCTIAVVHSDIGKRLPKMKSRMQKGSSQASAYAALLERADVIWFCVPDAAIARTARALASKINWKGKVALHSSGALTSDEFSLLRRRGAAVASVHPLMTFVPRSRSMITGVPFAIEGDAGAVRLARRIVRDLGGHSYAIRKADKAAYHAWGTFASPLFIALLATTERVAALAGVNRRAARRRMIPILQQTLANYATLDAEAAFSGPIIRGDVDTIKRHLRVLRKLPVARDVYAALVRAALLYLPAKNKKALRTVLDSLQK